MEQVKIKLIPNSFVDEKGIFKLNDALLLSGKYAGVCYNKEGFDKVNEEDIEKTEKRIKSTLEEGHHSVYDHIFISLNIVTIPKILAMVINNEKQYTTSEKSARYTPVEPNENSSITDKEIELYNKWREIFEKEITSKYGNILNPRKISTLAKENARYLISVFMPTTLIYTTSLRQINNIASWMQNFIANDKTDDFSLRLKEAIKLFLEELKRLNLLQPELMANSKNRDFSLFANNIKSKDIYYGDIYATTYDATYAYLAQAQRHRTISYEMERTNGSSFIVPNIIWGNPALETQWVNDIKALKDVIPQGEIIRIHEVGTYDNFILKCKERLCSEAQLEINNKTRDILLKYRDELKRKNHYLASDIEKYCHGARCTFPDFVCKKPCGFKEGITLTRKI